MWYFKGRRKKYKSPYTGKEVDAAVANSQAFPEYAAADSGKFLRVNADGKLDFDEYPIETNTTTVYDDTVTVVEGGVEVNITSYSGTADDFKELTVVVNDETLVYDNDYGTFDSQDLSINVIKDGTMLKLLADSAGDYAVSIANITQTVDEGFSAGVDAVTGLPKATSADEGKVVGVDENGKYTLVNGGGGGGGLTVVGYLNLGNHAVSNFSGNKTFAITPGSGEGDTYKDWFNASYVSVPGPIDFDYVAYLGAANSDATRVAITNVITTSSNLKFRLTNLTGTAFNLSDDVTLKFLLLKA